ncbi:MAG TPA: tetratricopeptide repeat protein [Bacteroidia bacterium]|nr:tetratricopeptide repeat protein [Bacteroidia bacterium]
MKNICLVFLLILFAPQSKAQTNEFYNHYFDGNALLVKGQYTKALESYNKALKLSQPDYVYFNRGNAYFGKKDYTAALADYNKAIQMNKNYTEAFCQRGLVKSYLGDKTCCDDLKKAIKMDSPDAQEAYEKHCKKKKE